MKHRMWRLKNKRSREKGSALIAASMCVFLLLMLGAGLVSVTVQALHSSRRIQTGILSFNVAESGCERAVRWLKDQPWPPAGTAAIDPFGGAQSLGSGSYTVSVVPDPSNSSASLKKYAIYSSGTIHGRTEQIEVVLRQQSFGKYAYFTDRETSAVSGGRIWFYSGDRVRGPAHSNNDNGSDFQINWNAPSSAPIFEDMVTSVAQEIDYSPSSPSTEADFLRIFRTGSRGYQLDVDPIALPTSSSIQKEAAWGGASGFPGSNGVYVQPTGGIYIRGDSSIVLQVDGSGNQQFRITQGSTVTTVTVNHISNTRTVQVGAASPTTVAGSGTGVLFSTGHITALSGTIGDNRLSGTPPTIAYRNAYTIATDVNAGKDITIPNPIRYASAPNPSLPVNDIANLRPGTLGLIGRNVTVKAGAPTSMQIDAIILANSGGTDGSFSVQDYNSKTPTGTLKVTGGIIQRARGAVGTINGSGNLVTGYAKDYHYDPRLADFPPPFFPTTGLYDRVSWKRSLEDQG